MSRMDTFSINGGRSKQYRPNGVRNVVSRTMRLLVNVYHPIASLRIELRLVQETRIDGIGSSFGYTCKKLEDMVYDIVLDTQWRLVQETRRDGIGSSSGYKVDTRARN